MARLVFEVSAVAGLVLGGAALWIALDHRGSSPPAPPSAQDCIELEAYDPALTRVPLAQLEHDLLGEMSPAMQRTELDLIRGKLEQYRPEHRECMYRAMLLAMVPSRGNPALHWGMDRSADELGELYLRIETDPPRDFEARHRVLGYVDTAVASIGTGSSDEERDWWRRMYLGLVITCQASSAELARLAATRPAPKDCPNW
ncbi:MAG TPA: hypothetical protein VMJ10_15535 [Kofleriaceae bacterium]|nr:hypothetical protein [Kofleriaceae bacterium]